MDRRVVPFRRWHYNWLLERESLEGGSFHLSPQIAEQAEHENSWTGVVEGAPIACAGTMLYWPGRHMAWAYILLGVRRHMPWVTEEVKKALDRVPGRIELTVRRDFPAGQRWAERLGFTVETPCLRAFGPEGEDHVGYVRFG